MSYEGLAEFHDLFIESPWEAIRPHLRRAFGFLPAGSTIVDIGAGSGMGTRVLAAESVPTSSRSSRLW